MCSRSTPIAREPPRLRQAGEAGNSMGKELHVIFGAGQVGVPLAARLLAGGKRVRVIRRSAQDSASGVEVLRGDAADAICCRQAAAGAAAMYHCMNPPSNASVWASLVPRAVRGQPDRGRRERRRAPRRPGQPLPAGPDRRPPHDRGHFDEFLQPEATRRDLVKRLSRALGRQIQVRTVPRVIVKAMGMVVPLRREMREMLYQWDEAFVVDDRRFR